MLNLLHSMDLVTHSSVKKSVTVQDVSYKNIIFKYVYSIQTNCFADLSSTIICPSTFDFCSTLLSVCRKAQSHASL